jgi:hypothetical protein
VSQAVKHGGTIMNLQANVNAWNRNISSFRTKKFKSVPSAGKVMLVLF